VAAPVSLVTKVRTSEPYCNFTSRYGVRPAQHAKGII